MTGQWGGRRTVTFIFTDLVGSTAAFSTMEPAEAERVRSAHIALVTRTVTAFGGVVVKTLGDGVMAALPSAEQGLGAAAAIQRAVTAHRSDSTGRPQSVRIGVSSGDATPSEGSDWHGRPVIEASRLCAAAAPDQIVVSEVVTRLADTRSHAFDTLGKLRLKGLEDPVRALALLWRIADGAPLRVALADDSALVREGIARLLEGAGIDVVSRAGDGDKLLADVRRLCPDVVISDVRMPPGEHLGGLVAAEAIRREEPGMAVILLSSQVERHIADRLLISGTNGVGYLAKDGVGDLEMFVDAIRTVASGGCVLDASLR